MNMRSSLLVASVMLTACTNTYVRDERRTDEVPNDRTLTLTGTFCTPPPTDVVRPIKVVLAMDASQSMSTTDPFGTRAQAAVDLIEGLPQLREVSIAVLVFADSVPTWLTLTGQRQFDSVLDYDDAAKNRLKQSILNFVARGTSANRGATDFVKPLDDVYALINSDLSNGRTGVSAESRPRYSVIFLSDGQPTINQDASLLCGDSVRRIRQLKDLADDVKVHTVNVFSPAQPIDSSRCDFTGPVMLPAGSSCVIPDLPAGSCPLVIVNQNAERLYRMSVLGGGDFRDFRNHEPINFLNFDFGQVRRTFVFDKLVASNFSAPAGSPIDAADTDSDGLLDADEVTAGTSPWLSDTDGDGFSDGVEVYFAARGGNFSPNQIALPDGTGLDPGCPIDQRGIDQDCDTLTDCDEQIIGTNAQRIDSDNDGVSDAVEFKLRAQPSSNDLAGDPDNDGLDTGNELMMHLDPLTDDTAQLSTSAYRYEVRASATVDPEGRQCWDFTVSNVSLANTLATPTRGAGVNDLFLTFSMVPGDDPRAQTILRTFRHTTSRFPVGGIKSPHDGVIRVEPAQFVPGCR